MKSFNNDPEVKNSNLNNTMGYNLMNFDSSSYRTELGIPEWLGQMKSILQGNGLDYEPETFPLEFIESIPVGIDEEQFDKLGHMLTVNRLEISLKRQKKLFPKDDFGVNASIQSVIEYHKNPLEIIRPVDSIESAYNVAWWAYDKAINSSRMAERWIHGVDKYDRPDAIKKWHAEESRKYFISSAYHAAKAAHKPIKYTKAEYFNRSIDLSGDSAWHAAEGNAWLNGLDNTSNIGFDAWKNFNDLEKKRLINGLKNLSND